MKRTYWKHCHVATMRDGRYNAIEDAVIVTRGKHIEWVGPRGERSASGSDLCIDLQGAWVTPGLIDCHTHLVFGGNRSQEFEQRLQGVSYAEISAAGGGIRHTVRHTRDATEDALFVSARKRLLALMRDGVTTVEIKSGYGLDLNSERKMLRVARRLGESLPVTVKTTCLAAHTVPMEFAGKADEYVNYVCSEILPTLAEERLVDAVDAFCETIAFTPAQVMRVLLRAQKLKLPVKLHAEQLSPLGGSSMAAELGALSADHLEYMTPEDAAAMGRAGTVAVLLPGAFHMLQETRRPPVDLPAPAWRGHRGGVGPESGNVARAVAAPDAQHGLHAVRPDSRGGAGRRYAQRGEGARHAGDARHDRGREVSGFRGMGDRTTGGTHVLARRRAAVAHGSQRRVARSRLGVTPRHDATSGDRIRLSAARADRRAAIRQRARAAPVLSLPPAFPSDTYDTPRTLAPFPPPSV